LYENEEAYDPFKAFADNVITKNEHKATVPTLIQAIKRERNRDEVM
jgi:hypothetical protein